jgi:hypothetical protein
MNSDDVVIGFVALIVCSFFLLRPLVRAWARRLEVGAGSTDTGELAELRERVAELDGMQVHLQELEERVDFAERMLAQRNHVPELPLHRTPV